MTSSAKPRACRCLRASPMKKRRMLAAMPAMPRVVAVSAARVARVATATSAVEAKAAMACRATLLPATTVVQCPTRSGRARRVGMRLPRPAETPLPRLAGMLPHHAGTAPMPVRHIRATVVRPRAATVAPLAVDAAAWVAIVDVVHAFKRRDRGARDSSLALPFVRSSAKNASIDPHFYPGPDRARCAEIDRSRLIASFDRSIGQVFAA